MPSREATIAGEILDLMVVVRWARENGYRRIVHVAASFGASITLLSAARFDFSDFSRVVFWNPVIHYGHTFTDAITPWGKTFFNQKHTDELAARTRTRIPGTKFLIGPRMTMELLHFRPQETVWPGTIPLLILHGDRDALVPHKDASDYAKRNKGVTLRTIRGVSHGFGCKIETVFEATRIWLTGERIP